MKTFAFLGLSATALIVGAAALLAFQSVTPAQPELNAAIEVILKDKAFTTPKK